MEFKVGKKYDVGLNVDTRLKISLYDKKYDKVINSIIIFNDYLFDHEVEILRKITDDEGDLYELAFYEEGKIKGYKALEDKVMNTLGLCLCLEV